MSASARRPSLLLQRHPCLPSLLIPRRHFIGSARASVTRRKAVSVQPSIIRVAEIGSTTDTSDPWDDSGTFDASGTEPNRLLLVFLNPFDGNSADAPVVDSLTIGGTAATLAKAFIAGATRQHGVAAYYRVAPANSATLAVAWDIVPAAQVLSGKIYGALLQDVNQLDPLGANAHINTNATDAFIDMVVDTESANSLLVGAFQSRGNGTEHSTRNSSVVPLATSTGTSPTLDMENSLAWIAADIAGTNTLGITVVNVNSGRGGLALEVKGT